MAKEKKVPEGDPQVPVEPTEPPMDAPVPPPADDEVGSLIAELEKAGVKTVDELSGKLRASREAGNLANQLGESRKEIAQLRELMEASRHTPAPNFIDEESADLGTIIEQRVNKTLDARDKRLAEQHRAQQEATLRTWSKIKTDKNYNLVKEVWEAKIKDPSYLYDVQTGNVSPLDEYNDTVVEYYKGIARRSVDTIKKLQGGGVTSPPPHMETGDRTPQLQKETTPTQARLKELKEKAAKGLLTEEEELEAISIHTQGLNWQ